MTMNMETLPRVKLGTLNSSARHPFSKLCMQEAISFAKQDCPCPIILLGQSTGSSQLHPYSENLIADSTYADTLRVDQPLNDLAMIIFTSGTTGPAKGVCLTHSALAFQAEAKQLSHGYNSEDVYLHVAPLCHVGGLVSWLAMLRVGASHVLMPHYSPNQLLELVSQHSVTAMIAVPAVIVDILATAKEEKIYVSVERILLGAGPLHQKHWAPLRALFPQADIWTAYGMTECASSITCARLEATEVDRDGGRLVGKPPSGIQIAIGSLDPKDAGSDPVFQTLPQGQHGEVITRGPHTMAGYWQDPEASSRAFWPGRWFRTGDLGYLDLRGNLWLSGRLKDVIRSGGENVSAVQVEEILLGHPMVEAAAVVGLPHDRLGEQVSALIQLKQQSLEENQSADLQGLKSDKGSTKSPSLSDELTQYCKEQGLSGFKLPRRMKFQGRGLPVNSAGKILKQEARAILLGVERIQSRL